MSEAPGLFQAGVPGGATECIPEVLGEAGMRCRPGVALSPGGLANVGDAPCGKRVDDTGGSAVIEQGLSLPPEPGEEGNPGRCIPGAVPDTAGDIGREEAESAGGAASASAAASKGRPAAKEDLPETRESP